MSLRHLLPALGLGALALALLVACLPWSVATPRLARAVGASLADHYGIAMTADGPVGFALLPLPRLDFEHVRLTAGTTAGPVLAEGGSLSLQLNMRALLAGRVDVDTLALTRTTITLPVDDADGRWSEPLRRLTARLSTEGVSRPRRLSLTDATVVGRDPRDGTVQTASDVDLFLSWPLWSSQVSLTGNFLWNETETRFGLSGVSPGELLAGRGSAFSARANWPAGDLAVEGTGTFGDGLTLRGQGRLQTRSLRETLDWTGTDIALSPFVDRFALEGAFETSGRTLLLPRASVRLGDNRLEGAGSVAFGENRPAVQATLAAESLNLAPLLASLMQAFGLDDAAEAAEGWSDQSLALRPFTGGDLDLRLSAGSARLGPIVLDDLAASVLVREGSIEGALSRATVKGGTVKGRIALSTSAADRGETEMRVQGIVDGLDLGGLLVDLGQEGWVLGGAQGQFAVEGTGRTAALLVRRLSGRAALSIDGGTIAGLDLADVIHRNGALAAGSLARRNGRTVFERASLTLRFLDGVGEIGDGLLRTPALTASLRGTLSLPDRTLLAKADLMPRGGPGDGATRQGLSFDIAGPWDAMAVRAVPRDGSEPDPELRGGSMLVPKALRVPITGGSVGLPATARAYAP